MATPSSSAVAMHSWSRTEPPGWTIDGHAGRRGGLDAVGERVEGVARAGAALGPAGRLLRGDLAGLDPVLLAGADAPRPRRPSPARCCSTSPSRRCGRPAPRRPARPSVGSRLVTTASRPGRRAKWCGSCTRKPPVIGRTWRGSGVGRPGLEQPGVPALADQRLDHAVARSPGAITTSACAAATISSTVAASIGRLTRDDPAERRTRVALEGPLVGVGEGRRPTAAPHGLACLMMAQAGPVAEVVHEQPRRVGVVEVEVDERDARRAGSCRPTTGRRRRCGRGRPAGGGSRRSGARAGARSALRCERRRAAARPSSPPSSNQATIAAS